MGIRTYSLMRLKASTQVSRVILERPGSYYQFLSKPCRHFFSCQTDPNPDTRERLSKIWVPTGGLASSSDEDSHSKLIRAGFIRQAHAGIHHTLPLGCRVLQKLEALIDKHMCGLGASKLSLSSISSEELWSRSGRLNKASSELFRFKDRKSTSYILSPTHEEEITSLISSAVKSYKELPIRVYQISRKYRDELRPRHGLFRSREFVMKDLYTFDYSQSSALSTYHAVRLAYGTLFDELKLSYLEAEADSGDIGGTLSHEFHFPTARGEDHVLSCSNCNYVANEEVVETVPPTRRTPSLDSTCDLLPPTNVRVWRGISKDRSTLINVWYEGTSRSGETAEPGEVNFHAVKTILPEFDSSVEDAMSIILQSIDCEAKKGGEESPGKILRLVNLVDFRIPTSSLESIRANDHRLPIFPSSFTDRGSITDITNIIDHPTTGNPLNLLRIRDGDQCPRCTSGQLKVHKTIELGHTFHLGTRYSEPLVATISVPVEVLEREGITAEEDSEHQTKVTHARKVFMQMGCHGIGVSRMMGAVADILADEKGLNWPRVIAPYEAVIIPGKKLETEAEDVYTLLNSTGTAEANSKIDLVLDDRKQSFAWKMQDADLVGYPVIIVVGRRWKLEKMCEIQCRRLGIKKDIHVDDLKAFAESILQKL